LRVEDGGIEDRDVTDGGLLIADRELRDCVMAGLRDGQIGRWLDGIDWIDHRTISDQLSHHQTIRQFPSSIRHQQSAIPILNRSILNPQ